MNPLRIGIVGFSGRPFDQDQAVNYLRGHLNNIVQQYGSGGIELVSGYTNIGVPKLAYEIADELGITTVGISAKEALTVDCGLYPVDKVMIIGEHFGDESETFIDYIDMLIRIGGGEQSMREVEHFKEANSDKDLNRILIEEDLPELK